MFKLAEEQLGHRCPAELRGHMIPVGMVFERQGKMLDDQPKQRTEPFQHKCKVCDREGHEAFECPGGGFQHSGKPGKSYRELFHLGVVDRNGRYRT